MNLYIGWPQGIYLLLNIVSLPLLARQVGGKAAPTILSWLFVTLPLLWWGGFFS